MLDKINYNIVIYQYEISWDELKELYIRIQPKSIDLDSSNTNSYLKNVDFIINISIPIQTNSRVGLFKYYYSNILVDEDIGSLQIWRIKKYYNSKMFV